MPWSEFSTQIHLHTCRHMNLSGPIQYTASLAIDTFCESAKFSPTCFLPILLISQLPPCEPLGSRQCRSPAASACRELDKRVFLEAFIFFSFKARRASCNCCFSSELCKNYSTYFPLAIETRVVGLRLPYLLVFTHLNTNHVLPSFATADITLTGNELGRSTVSLRPRKLTSKKELLSLLRIITHSFNCWYTDYSEIKYFVKLKYVKYEEIKIVIF